MTRTLPVSRLAREGFLPAGPEGRTDRRNMLIPKPGIRSEFIPPGGQQQGCKIDASNHAALGLSKQ